MTSIDPRGHEVPGTDSPNWGHFDKLSRSINDPIIVTSTGDRTAKLAALAALSPAIVPSTTKPIFFYRTDKVAGTELEYTEDGTNFPAIDARQTAITTAGILTAASGWTLLTQLGVIRSGTVYVRLEFTRTGGTITVPANGNISNIDVATIAAGWQPDATFNVGLAAVGTGPVAVGDVNGGTTIRITAVAPGANIVNTDVLSLAGNWPLA